jgi:uncharacterized protein YjiS (DUF1127 family)
MSGVYVEGKFGQHLNACEDILLNSNKRIVLNKKIAAQLPPDGKIFNTVALWMQRSKQRKNLAQLDKHLLDDIGLTEDMVAKEIAKPFWR